MKASKNKNCLETGFQQPKSGLLIKPLLIKPVLISLAMPNARCEEKKNKSRLG